MKIGAFLNSLLVTTYIENKSGLIENFIEDALTDRMEALLAEQKQEKKPKIIIPKHIGIKSTE